MVRKVGNGYRVFSEKGKPLSKVFPTKSQAQARLKQVEMFKKNRG